MEKKNNVQQKILIAVSVFLCFVCLSQCRRTKEDPYAKVAVNRAFEKDPPIATDIQVTQLDSSNDLGNLLYEATLPRERIKSDVLAVMINDTDKIVLHDDGKNGDRKAGDGIYSTVMNINTDSLGMEFASKITVARRLLAIKQPLFKFVGRLEFTLSGTERNSLSKFIDVNKERINFRRSFSMLPIVNLPLLTPVAESFKHTALTVTDPSVVTDPLRTFNPCTNTGTVGGAWTFGKLMTDLANSSGSTPESFMLNWLNTWTADQTVNNDLIQKRTNISSIINTWHTLCGGPSAALSVNEAPFKLLAIVNRFDLRSGGAYGGGNAGEGRFVFCATDANCNTIPFFVIFEYGVNKTTCSSIHQYAQQWVDLSSMTFPSPAYNAALQAITDQFATAGTNSGKPNGSSLDQLRTNEIALNVLPWELREFNISAQTHQLVNVTTKREPQTSFNGQDRSPIASNVILFGQFVNNHIRDIINDKMDFPDNLPEPSGSTPFIAGKAHTIDPTNFHWDAVEPSGTGHIVNDTARFHISLNTCSGCHGGETNSGENPSLHEPFTQIGIPLTPGGPATLSKFLTGNPAFSSSPFIVSDRAGRPTGAPIQWPFNDLERRGRDLMDFVNGTCLPRFHPPATEPGHLPFFTPEELTKRLTFSPNTMTD